MKEAYVSFEVAKLLKEKGFAEPCYMSYWLRTKDNIEFAHLEQHCNNYSDCICAPTHQMAMAWLREVHNIDADIEAAVGMLGVKVYIPYISTYKPLEGTSSKVRQIKRGLYYKDDRGIIPALQHFETYEEATEEALKYVLENLI